MNEIKKHAFVFRTIIKIYLIGLFFSFLFGSHCFGQLAELPTVERFVVDQTQTLKPNEIEILNTKLANFEEEKGSQVVVVFVPTTAPEEIEQYSIRLADEVKAGRKNIDDGLIILVAKDDRRMRIEVGYGLEGAIPDIYAKRIIENIMKPQFRNGDFYNGVDQAVDMVFGLIRGEELPLPDAQENMEENVIFQFMPFLFIIGIILFSVLRGVLIRAFGKKYTGIGIFILTTIIVTVFINFIVGILAGFMATLFMVGSSGGRRGGGKYYGGTGGFGGFSSSGGGGFGGFSGGGGGFGGGGASGGW